MKQTVLKRIILLLPLLLTFTIFQLSVQASDPLETITGEVSGTIENNGYAVDGNFTVGGDTELIFSKASEYTKSTGILNVFNGNLIKSFDDTIFTITYDQNQASVLNNIFYYGIVAEVGGTVDLSNAKVIISVPDEGIISTGGTIKLGNNSEITSFENDSYYVVGSSKGGNIIIGNDATIIGNTSISQSIVLNANGGSITIGSGAKILNDLVGARVSENDNIAVLAYNGGSITIGSFSQIETRANEDTLRNNAVTVSEGNANISIGDYANIITNQNSSYAIQSYGDGGEVTVGGNSQITTKGKEAHALHATFGGHITIGESTQITTEKDSSIGIFATLGDVTSKASIITTASNIIVTTSGNSSYGVTVQNSTDQENLNNIIDSNIFLAEMYLGEHNRISTKGDDADALFANGSNTKIEAKNGLKVETSGTDSAAIRVQLGSKVGIGENAQINTENVVAIVVNSGTEKTINPKSELTFGRGLRVTSTGIKGTPLTPEELAEKQHKENVIYNDNSLLTIGEDFKIIVGSEEAYAKNGTYALVASGDLAISTIAKNAQITIFSDKGVGVVASLGADISFADGLLITIKGESSHAIDASANASITTGQVTIISEGNGSAGIYASDSIIKIGNNSVITAKAENPTIYSYAVVSIGENAEVVLGKNTRIDAGYLGSNGATAEMNANILFGNGSSITTSGSGSYALRSLDAGYIGTEKIVITAEGRGAIAIYSEAGIVNIGADSIITINVKNPVENPQAYSYAVASALKESEITLGKNVQITALSDNTRGIYAQNGGRISIAAGVSITTQGTQAHAIFANTSLENIARAEVTTEKIMVTTLKDNSRGVYSINSVINIGNSSVITTEGHFSHALVISNNGNIILGENVSVLAQGDFSDAFLFIGNFSDPSFTYEKLIATSENSNLITNASNNSINISFKNNSNLYGDLYSDINGSNITMNLDSSTWQGSANQLSAAASNLNLANAANWIIGKDSSITNINMNNTALMPWITFLHDTKSYYKTSVTNTFSGEGNIFMNVDLSIAPKGDFLEINTASGAFNLKINHNGKAGVDKLQLISVEENTDVQFSLLDNPELHIGFYTYELESENNKKDWFLKLTHYDLGIEQDFKKMLITMFELAKAVDATLSDELLSNKNNLWLISYYKLQKFSHSEFPNDFEQQIIGGIIGLDQMINDNLSIGQFIGLTIGSQNFRSGSIGTITNFTTGIYNTYINEGFTANIYLRFADYLQKLELTRDSGDKLSELLNTQGFSISAQISQKISFAQSSFYLMPKLKASYTYIIEKTYSLEGMKIANISENGVVFWLGGRIGLDQKNKSKLNDYYLEAAWIYDTNPSITYTLLDDPEKTSISISKNRFEVGLGFEVSNVNNSNFSVEIKFAKGQGIIEPLKIKLGGSFFF